jgi:Flp pilus assembly protein TadG
MRPASRRRGARGNVVIVFALSLVVLIGFAALSVDMGRIYNVKGDLQNAVDAAALGAIRDLNGSPDQFAPARASAQYFASLHQANGTPVTLESNDGNSSTGDIVLGHWDFDTRTFSGRAWRCRRTW